MTDALPCVQAVPKMTFKAGSALLLKLVPAAPVVPLVVANLNGAEPWADNLFMYVLSLLVFGAAGLTTLRYFYWNNLIHDAWDTITYGLVGAVGAAGFTTLVDAADAYFTPSGIGWYLTGVAFLLGALFGITFRSLCWRLATSLLTQE
jgi:hypothetical protein